MLIDIVITREFHRLPMYGFYLAIATPDFVMILDTDQGMTIVYPYFDNLSRDFPALIPPLPA